jgi:beta-galactosidase
MLAEGLINNEVVAEHIRWPAGRKRRLVLRIDENNVQPIADGSDITPVVAYLVDAGGAVKRLSDEYIEFSVSGEGELIGGRKNGINPQKLLWGEAVALIRSTEKPGRITIKAKVLNEGINSPSEAEIEFSTTRSNHRLIFNESPLRDYPNSLGNSNMGNSPETEELIKELRILKKELLEYKLNEVGRQQEDFIQ